jgi:hypothetical protein
MNRADKKTKRKIKNNLMLRLTPPNDKFLVKKSINLSIQLKYKMIVK